MTAYGTSATFTQLNSMSASGFSDIDAWPADVAVTKADPLSLALDRCDWGHWRELREQSRRATFNFC